MDFWSSASKPNKCHCGIEHDGGNMHRLTMKRMSEQF